MNPARVDSFLFEFKRWAATEAQIVAVGRKEESAVELIVVVAPPIVYLKHRQWTSLFGTVVREQIEECGECTAMRIWYSDGLEVEFGFCDETRVAATLDGEVKVLFERRGSQCG